MVWFECVDLYCEVRMFTVFDVVNFSVQVHEMELGIVVCTNDMFIRCFHRCIFLKDVFLIYFYKCVCLVSKVICKSGQYYS